MILKKAYFFETAIGKVGIAENGRAVTNVFFGNTVVPEEYEEENTPLLQKAAGQLCEYLEGRRRDFDLLLEPEGTDFEKSVWRELQKIPFGEIISYKQIAERIGSPDASRAVGRANAKNPISILIPCHRVVGSDGKLTGYAGGLPIKERLLRLEKKEREK